MTGRELFSLMEKGQMPERIPFVPTIFEHAAQVINKTPSQIAVNEELLLEAQLASYETYKHDLVSVGVDIYNVEYEALGAKVEYFDDEQLPSVDQILVNSEKDLDKLKIPDPQQDARMPLFLNTTEKINKKIGKEVIVSGTVVGPFTLAAIMRGFENFITDLVLNPDFALKLMDFAKEVGITYAKAFINKGVGVAINESWISPPLLSPNLYQEFVFPKEKEMIQVLKKKGLKNIALISGGDTTSIAKDLVKTGTSLLLADYNTDHRYFKDVCAENDILLRASIESKLVEKGTEQELKEGVNKVITACADYERFIFGCGVVSYKTKAEQVLNLKKIVEELTPKR